MEPPPVPAPVELSREAMLKLEAVRRMSVEYAQAMLHLGHLDVVKVWRVVNEDLDMQYAIAVSGAEKQAEVRVLHGTSLESIESIVQHGFKVGGVDVPVKHGSAHGKCIYLTTDANMAACYSRKKGSRYIVLSELCVTRECLRFNPKASVFNAKEQVFNVYVQPDKALVRPLYVCQVEEPVAASPRPGVVTPTLQKARLNPPAAVPAPGAFSGPTASVLLPNKPLPPSLMPIQPISPVQAPLPSAAPNNPTASAPASTSIVLSNGPLFAAAAANQAAASLLLPQNAAGQWGPNFTALNPVPVPVSPFPSLLHASQRMPPGQFTTSSNNVLPMPNSSSSNQNPAASSTGR